VAKLTLFQPQPHVESSESSDSDSDIDDEEEDPSYVPEDDSDIGEDLLASPFQELDVPVAPVVQQPSPPASPLSLSSDSDDEVSFLFLVYSKS
jgi:hypothetical protein